MTYIGFNGNEYEDLEMSNMRNERAAARRNGQEFAYNPSEQCFTLQAIDQDTMDYLDTLSEEELEEPAMQKCQFCPGYHYVGTMERCPLYRKAL